MLADLIPLCRRCHEWVQKFGNKPAWIDDQTLRKVYGWSAEETERRFRVYAGRDILADPVQADTPDDGASCDADVRLRRRLARERLDVEAKKAGRRQIARFHALHSGAPPCPSLSPRVRQPPPKHDICGIIPATTSLRGGWDALEKAVDPRRT